MNLYSWYVFHVLVEEKSFMKTASRLNISQSAVSHAIAKLEENCGCSLFVRNRNNVELTSSGKQLLPSVRQLLYCSDSLNQNVENLKSARKGEVQIAAFHSAASLWLPQIIQNFKEKYPEIDIFLRQIGDGKIRSMIEKSEVDLAFTTQDAIGASTDYILCGLAAIFGNMRFFLSACNRHKIRCGRYGRICCGFHSFGGIHKQIILQRHGSCTQIQPGYSNM